MKFAIYSRKSKTTDKGESIGNQVEMCRNYINANAPGEEHEFLIYEDEGFSGKNTKRPEFLRMMQDAKKKRFQQVVVYRLDRISRNIVDFMTITEKLQSSGIGFISINERFDTTTPMGRAMMQIAAVFAQLERETIAERVQDITGTNGSTASSTAAVRSNILCRATCEPSSLTRSSRRWAPVTGRRLPWYPTKP